MSILADWQIKDLVEEKNMIEPFIDEQVENNKISHGLGHYGYDVRLGDTFYVFSDVGSEPIDPKNFDKDGFTKKHDEESILIPPNSFALGYTVERIEMPKDVMGLVIGKSSYARCGVVANFTPLEPSWRGHITVELSNTTPRPAKVYVGEGIAQIMFFSGKAPNVLYEDKGGKYQDQSAEPKLAEVV